MAVKEIQVFRLDVGEHFGRLTEQEQRYAHHMARAAWLGARIILSQVSPESPAIFDFILELHRACGGKWQTLAEAGHISSEDLQQFLTYAATFLSNIGNYFGSGDQKFVPGLSDAALRKLACISPKLTQLYDEISPAISAIPPFSLGFPSATTQSSYYLGALTPQEITSVDRLLEQQSIFPENTRLQKPADTTTGGTTSTPTINILVASAQTTPPPTPTRLPSTIPTTKANIHLCKGDHAAPLRAICTELSLASAHAATEAQRTVLRGYTASFETGDLHAYRAAQRAWVRDITPRVESVLGFVEPYRDPAGVRGTLAYCSSIIFPGINLPNYNDIRQEVGFKNIIFANRMRVESQAKQYPFIDPAEAETFAKHKFPAYYWWVVLHEILGHGTGRMLVESAEGKYSFDINNPPINPLTGAPITSWYKPGQTWTGQFGDLATTVDECRAELVGAYLMDDPEVLALLGLTEDSEIRAEDLAYNLYQQLGVDGLRGLANFNVDSGKWGQAHSRAHFAILQCLLRNGDGVITVIHDKASRSLTVRVDRSKIRTHGKPALGTMLLRLHMYRCTADVAACRAYYEDLSRVDEEHLAWREAVLANKPPPLVFVQANTFLEGDRVVLKEYEPTVEGVIQSWAERMV
ncbi:14d01ecd-4b10-4b08-8e49-fad5338ec7f3 [Thermothielavioides terrestris]|uniref:14d01ecd-4b10-4b08-8e49-fad5338ec7f3 n=1 Tax=Thermothielavioides terrestris TaxID=2587410 RepID=A0A446BCY9_9PEZI|nr:14d01ecd-4b10-4b08-8e49-fad5338ec7f3 [Thermothielavioides terrestris]